MTIYYYICSLLIVSSFFSFDVEPKSEMNIDDEDSDDEDASKSSTNTKTDKMRK